MPLLTQDSIGNSFILNDGSSITIVRSYARQMSANFIDGYVGSNGIKYNRHGIAIYVSDANKSISRELTTKEIIKTIKETKRLAQLDQNKKKDLDEFGNDDFCIFDVI